MKILFDFFEKEKDSSETRNHTKKVSKIMLTFFYNNAKQSTLLEYSLPKLTMAFLTNILI